MKEKRDIPLGWALDKDGNPTTDAAAANEGVLLPFGFHKGYALELIVSLLSFALSGADMDINIPRFFECTDKEANVGYFMGASTSASTAMWKHSRHVWTACLTC